MSVLQKAQLLLPVSLVLSCLYKTAQDSVYYGAGNILTNSEHKNNLVAYFFVSDISTDHLSRYLVNTVHFAGSGKGLTVLEKMQR
jgi:hypothetical protein